MTNRHDDELRGSADEDELLDFVVGQFVFEDPANADAYATRVDSEPELAAAAAAFRRDLEPFRQLRCEPSGHVGARVRWLAKRRLLRHGNPSPLSGGRLRVVARRSLEVVIAAAAVALLALGVRTGLGGATGEVTPVDWVAPKLATASPEVESGRGSDPAMPIEFDVFDPAEVDEEFAETVRGLEKGWLRPNPLRALLDARAHMALLGRAHEDRGAVRRQALADVGVRPAHRRILALADDVAAQLDDALRRVPKGGRLGARASVDLAAACRALLAAESVGRAVATYRLSRSRRDLVDRSYALLESEMGDLDGGPLAAVLSAWVDRVAARDDPAALDVLCEHGGRLARRTLQLHDGRAEHLLAGDTAPGQLGDAGRVLSLLPEFGVEVEHARRARLMVAARLHQRRAARSEERPDILAALAYGFGDIGDHVVRERIERELLLWGPSELTRAGDYVALEQLAWSRYPARAGWAQFQQRLRRVTAAVTPVGVRDAAALLLALAVHDVAPGAQRLVARAGGL